MKKYTFVEFVAALESKDFDVIDQNYLNWANQFVDSFPDIAKNEYHGGDCTKMPGACPICFYETLLEEYRIYYFEEEKFRKEYL